uniref:ARAD1C28314p n=1 Tax=Blastobotrys adeninivorans TaxID=409370 RepID=A0A060T2G0_BLAAD
MATTTASSQQPSLSFGPCRPLTEAHPTAVHHHRGRLQARLTGSPVSGTTTSGTTGDHHQPSCLKFNCPVRPDKSQLGRDRLEGSQKSNSGDQGKLCTRRPLMSPPPNNRIAIDYDSDSDSEDYDYLHGSDDDSDDGSEDEHFDDNEEDDDCVGGLEL